MQLNRSFSAAALPPLRGGIAFAQDAATTPPTPEGPPAPSSEALPAAATPLPGAAETGASAPMPQPASSSPAPAPAAMTSPPNMPPATLATELPGLVHAATFDQFLANRQPGDKLPPEAPKPDSEAEGVQAANKLIAAYKIVGGTLLAGGAAILLCGTPVSIALGTGLAFALLQTALTHKICKAQDPLSQKIIDFSTQLMGVEKASEKKSLSIAPVWAGVTALISLVEAGINYVFRAKETPQQVLQRIEAKVRTAGSLRWLYTTQLKGLRLKGALLQKLREWPAIQQWAKNAARQSGVHFLSRYRMPLYFSLATISGLIGGYIQAMVAVKLEDHLTHKPKIG